MAEEALSRVTAAGELESSSPDAAAEEYRAVALGTTSNTVESIKVKESAIQKLTDLYVRTQNATSLRGLLSELRPLFGVIPKAKTAKVVRTIIDSIAKIPGSTDLQVRHSSFAKHPPCIPRS